MTEPVLIFVYNADSGLFNTLSDIAHKTFAPESYSCHLCALTYGTFSMRQEWKTFLESLGCRMEFLHRNELEERYGFGSVALPAVFLKDDEHVVELVSAAVINACTDIAELKLVVQNSFRDYRSGAL